MAGLSGKPAAPAGRFAGALTAANLLRLALLLCLVLPVERYLARHVFRDRGETLVLDDSLSMHRRYGDLPGKILGQWQALADPGPVIFARGRPGPRTAEPQRREGPTDLGRAIESSLSTFSGVGENRLLLVTDGISEPFASEGLLARLRERRVGVYAIAPQNPVRQTGVVDLVVPAKVHLWEPFVVKGRVAASIPGRVTVVLRRDGRTVEEREVTVEKNGIGEAEFLQEADRPGLIRFELAPALGAGPAAAGSVLVGRSPRVLYLSDDAEVSRGLAGLIREAGVDLEVLPVDEMAARGGDLGAFEVVVLDDVAAPALSGRLLEQLHQAVREQGAGLLVVGGRKGLGSGEYRDSRLEELLPVTIGSAGADNAPSIALVLALDTSASMRLRGTGEKQFYTDTPRKIDIARDSAREVVRIIPPENRLGILRNSTDLFWVHPLGTIDDRPAVQRAIDGIDADGEGVYFYATIEAAYEALRRDPAAIRHIILFCDADDVDQQEFPGKGLALDLVRRLAADGITLSVLAIGHPMDKDAPFLRSATILGGGDFYLVSNILALPQYFVSEVRKLGSRHFLEEQLQVVAADYHPLLAGVPVPYPPLAGVAAVSLKKGARAPLVTTAGIPLVSLAEYGRGRVAVFSSDNGYRWARPWVEGLAARRFWLQLLFAVAPREREKSSFYSTLAVDERRAGLLFTRASTADPGTEHRLLLHGLAGLPEGGGEPVEMHRTGLRAYRSAGPLPEPGEYQVRVVGDGLAGPEIFRSPLVIPPSPELSPVPERQDLVAALVRGTGGSWVASPEQFRGLSTARPAARERLRLLICAAGLCLLLVEFLVRYKPWR